MTIAGLVAQYGLAALFVGAALEGEAAVVAGGLIAHQGLFPLAGAMAVAAAGSFTADQTWFVVGRRFRDHRYVVAARKKAAFAKALAALERHPRGFIFAFRFIYGFRTISPIAIGTSQVSRRLYLVINAAAAIVWAITFTLVGYLFGNAFERFMGRLRPHGTTLWYIVGALVAAGLVIGAAQWWRGRRA